MAAAALAAVVFAGLGAAAPANAFGVAERECWGGSWVYGTSNSIGATTDVYGYDDCNRSMASYGYYSGGVVYYRTYSYSNSVAYSSKLSGTVGVGGRHRSETTAPLLAYQFPFYT